MLVLYFVYSLIFVCSFTLWNVKPGENGVSIVVNEQTRNALRIIVVGDPTLFQNEYAPDSGTSTCSSGYTDCCPAEDGENLRFAGVNPADNRWEQHKSRPVVGKHNSRFRSKPLKKRGHSFWWYRSSLSGQSVFLRLHQ